MAWSKRRTGAGEPGKTREAAAASSSAWRRGGKRPAPGGGASVEVGVGEDQGALLGGEVGGEAEEVSAAGEVGEGVALDEGVTGFVEEGGEEDKVEGAVRGEVDAAGVAEEGADGGHDAGFKGAREGVETSSLAGRRRAARRVWMSASMVLRSPRSTQIGAPWVDSTHAAYLNGSHFLASVCAFRLKGW